MKKFQYLAIGVAAGSVLFAGALLAQSSKSKSTRPHESSKSQPAGLAVDDAGGNGVGRAAPESQRGGVNPLFESKDKANLKPGTGASSTQPRKDAEDMTTRYRPGNNKTTRSNSAAPASGAASTSAKAKETPKKHVAGVKYSD